MQSWLEARPDGPSRRPVEQKPGSHMRICLVRAASSEAALREAEGRLVEAKLPDAWPDGPSRRPAKLKRGCWKRNRGQRISGRGSATLYATC